MYDCKEKTCLYYDGDTRWNCERYHNTTACKGVTPLTTAQAPRAEVALDCGVSNNAIVDLMKRMEQGDGEPQWINCGETVFEALWALVEDSEGRERLAREFPHYC